MGDDIADERGDVDVEACDDRRARLDRASEAFAIIVRPDFLTASDDERDEEEVRRTRARRRAFGAIGRVRRRSEIARARARDARRSALRGEIRRLVREAKDLTSAFDDALEMLARRRRETEFETATREAASARARGDYTNGIYAVISVRARRKRQARCASPMRSSNARSMTSARTRRRWKRRRDRSRRRRAR